MNGKALFSIWLPALRRSALGGLAVAVVAASLGGCTLTLPVSGEIGRESFAGRATGHMDAAGEMEIVLTSGTRCSGRFVYTTPRQGSGTLKCSDGRSGKFTFVSTGQRGTGDGTLDGKPFTFTFG